MTGSGPWKLSPSWLVSILVIQSVSQSVVCSVSYSVSPFFSY